jgi:transcriptional regulator with XRE-family HTH domain
MGELLASGAKVMALPRDQMSRTLRRCVEKYSWGSVSRFASEFKLTEGVLIYWLNGKQRPLLGTVLRLAYKLDLTVVNFLCGNLEPEGISLREMSDVEGQAGRATTVEPPLSRDEVKRVLTLAASSNQRETLKAVVSRTGWLEQRVRYNFPELCATIVRRWTELYSKRVDERKALSILQAALEEYPPPTVVAVAERAGSAPKHLEAISQN